MWKVWLNTKYMKKYLMFLVEGKFSMSQREDVPAKNLIQS